MALIAKKHLKIGFTNAYAPGNIVPAESVNEHGWQDDVEDDGNGDFGGSDEPTQTVNPRSKRAGGRKAAQDKAAAEKNASTE